MLFPARLGSRRCHFRHDARPIIDHSDLPNYVSSLPDWNRVQTRNQRAFALHIPDADHLRPAQNGCGLNFSRTRYERRTRDERPADEIFLTDCRAAVPAVIGLTGCAGHSLPGIPAVAAPAPVFSSTAPATALEGQLYSYGISATDPAGGAITYTLLSGPAGATISGSALTWTPTHEQSRVSNSFTVAAITSGGGMAAQSFSVTPAGIIWGSVARNYYSRSAFRRFRPT
jgi:hypothetical protein